MTKERWTQEKSQELFRLELKEEVDRDVESLCDICFDDNMWNEAYNVINEKRRI